MLRKYKKEKHNKKDSGYKEFFTPWERIKINAEREGHKQYWLNQLKELYEKNKKQKERN